MYCACNLLWPILLRLLLLNSYFVNDAQAKLMFDGEMASLEAILKTEIVKVPKPMKVIELDSGGCVLVMEHVDMKGLNK